MIAFVLLLFLGGVVSARAPPKSELLTGLHMVVDPVQSIQIKTKCVLLSSSDLLSMNASESGRRRKLPVRMFILLNIYIYILCIAYLKSKKKNT